MIIDRTDLLLLKEFIKLGKNKTTTWEIMKRIYKNGKDAEHMKIKRKLNKMEEYGIIFSHGNPKEHILVEDNVKLKKIKFEKKEVDCICIFTDGSWSAFQLN